MGIDSYRVLFPKGMDANEYGCKVVAFAADLGQGDELTPVRDKAIATGADKVYIDVRAQEDIGLKDTAEGRTDVFFWGVTGPTFKALPREVRDKLDVYIVPSGSWSFVLNPCPNEAPYTVEVGGKTVFNPFAIREVRFALNFLMNRKYIVDEILGGDGRQFDVSGHAADAVLPHVEHPPRRQRRQASASSIPPNMTPSG